MKLSVPNVLDILFMVDPRAAELVLWGMVHQPLRRPINSPKCYWHPAGFPVHVKPWCHCPRRRGVVGVWR